MCEVSTFHPQKFLVAPLGQLQGVGNVGAKVAERWSEDARIE
jgi:hypothetical protein